MNSGGLLTLDLNTKRCGVAAGCETDSAPCLLSWQLFGTETEDDLARSCAVLYRNISDLAKVIHPRVGLYEAPLNPDDLRGNTNYNAMRGLISLAAVAMAALQNAGARTYPARVQRWRKHFLGHGFPTDPKQAAMDQCAAYGWAPKNHDEADAGGIWHWGMFTYFKNDVVPCSPLFTPQLQMARLA